MEQQGGSSSDVTPDEAAQDVMTMAKVYALIHGTLMLMHLGSDIFFFRVVFPCTDRRGHTQPEGCVPWCGVATSRSQRQAGVGQTGPLGSS